MGRVGCGGVRCGAVRWGGVGRNGVGRGGMGWGLGGPHIFGAAVLSGQGQLYCPLSRGIRVSVSCGHQPSLITWYGPPQVYYWLSPRFKVYVFSAMIFYSFRPF